MKVCRNELKDLLDINLNALKQIERRNTLEKRLLEKGYILLNKSIENKKTIYELGISKDKQIINKLYNISKTDCFINYFNIRTAEEPDTIDYIASKVKINKNTVIKWDNTLQDKKIISKDGYYYFKLDKALGELAQVTIEEYKSFWKNKAYVNAFKKLQDKYTRSEITLAELQLAKGELDVIIRTIENKYYYKVKKYKVNKDNKLYIDTMNLIRGYDE
ncbi:hypothetical protein [Clostridium beijerinckii]|uniref:hypothetical protein n=1 Tax=Clostridium beijerinckii TaxID=1520 RepID=UPI00098CEFE5|nr:hypothetical protein [Clostridium beijerinckii]MBA8935816.1 putative transcriptional regulator [Clostridium beijerinckii]NRU40210.1 putative transcriptional regulator [Clostridium beijerinckii]NSA96512.1 putative transcriptional regulator [Clostridium beijerinckii]OOM61392.1 hypothetical protein CLBEIC_56390 [Clostridium beijerinckii]CUU47045.1 conserved protein of unknown function [Clostridium beijerinckii]